MGKSPGKWIKTVLFGKKSSKSNLSKNVTPDKKSGANTAMEDPSGISSVISDPPQYTDRGVEDIELENGSSDTHQGVDSQYNNRLVLLSEDDMRRQEEAVTKAQAAFRGYLARRAFRALKGIIRLQALIRGHLVRRQAVATLHCMQAIVKLQALARGRKVRLSDAMPEVRKTYNIKEPQDSKLVNVGAKSISRSEKLAANSFVRKLLVSLPTAMPLSLQYDLAEPNSAWNWLERWSLSRFWVPPTRAKKTLNAKSQKKPGSQQAVETDSGKSKRTIRKAATTTNGDNGSLASLESDKPKRNQRKITNHQTESVHEQPQNELERVKRSLRKVSASAAAASEKPETENEKPQSHTSGKRVSASAAAGSEKLETEIEKPQSHTSVEKVSEFAEPEVSEQKTIISADNGTESDTIVDKQALPETQTKTSAIDEAIDVPHYNHPVVEISSSENGEKTDTPTLHDESSMKEEDSGKENQKMRKRRSLPAKQEYPENISQNTPSIPSYMAATQSAKAKLRAQGSGKFGEDGAENGFVRRHSLPALANGKMSALSPRIQKPVQANGKGGNKTNRLLTTSRDDKALQPGWRR